MTRYRVICDGEVIGTSELQGRDPGMAIALGRFTPAPAYARVAWVFRLFADAQPDWGPVDQSMMERYEQARDALGLTLATEDGVGIPVSVVHITDYRADLDDEEACELEVQIPDAAFFADAASPGA